VRAPLLAVTEERERRDPRLVPPSQGKGGIFPALLWSRHRLETVYRVCRDRELPYIRPLLISARPNPSSPERLPGLGLTLETQEDPKPSLGGSGPGLQAGPCSPPAA